MITYTTRPSGYGPPVLDCTGLAGDDKDEFAEKVNAPNGSTYYEIDGNHYLYMFNGESKTWVKQ